MEALALLEAIRKEGKRLRRSVKKSTAKTNARLDAQDAAIVALTVAVAKLIGKDSADATMQAAANDLNAAAADLRNAGNPTPSA